LGCATARTPIRRAVERQAGTGIHVMADHADLDLVGDRPGPLPRPLVKDRGAVARNWFPLMTLVGPPVVAVTLPRAPANIPSSSSPLPRDLVGVQLICGVTWVEHARAEQEARRAGPLAGWLRPSIASVPRPSATPESEVESNLVPMRAVDHRSPSPTPAGRLALTLSLATRSADLGDHSSPIRVDLLTTHLKSPCIALPA